MTAALAFLGHTEILIIVGVVVLLFGAAKIPALMRSMGSGISEFKKGIKDGEKEAADEKKDALPDAKPNAAETKPGEPESK